MNFELGEEESILRTWLFGFVNSKTLKYKEIGITRPWMPSMTREKVKKERNTNHDGNRWKEKTLKIIQQIIVAGEPKEC